MGKVDIESKRYLSKSEHFADAFNYLIYDGRPVIRPEELRPLDSTELAVPYGTDARAPTQKYRDVLKAWHAMRDGAAVYVVLGVESQDEVHYAMPVRTMLYDSMSYAGQVEKASRSYRKNGSPERVTRAEFLSGFHKGDRLMPVITLVVYLGANAWDGPLSIREMLNVVGDELLPFVPDYHINLIAPALMSGEDFLKFETDLGKVLEYIKYSDDKEALERIIRNGDRFRSVDADSAALIDAVTGSGLRLQVREGKVDMCRAIDEMRRESIEQGLERGIEQGLERGIAIGELRTLSSLVAEGLISIADAARRTGLSVAEFQRRVAATL